jgi:hypothetical protein
MTNDFNLQMYLLLAKSRIGLSVLSPKLLNPSFGIDYLLFPCKKRMALRAYINLYFFPCRLCRKRLTAGANDSSFIV